VRENHCTELLQRAARRQAVEILELLGTLEQAAVHHDVGVSGLNEIGGSCDFTAGRSEQRDLHRFRTL